MRRELGDGGLDVPVAVITDLRLLGAVPDRIVLGMDAMAADAGEVAAFVDAAVPAHAVVVRVARQAHLVLLRHGRRRVLAEKADRFARTLGMLVARSMAGLALHLCERRVRVALHRMLGLEYLESVSVLFVVATDAGVGTFLRIASRRGGRRDWRRGFRLRRIGSPCRRDGGSHEHPCREQPTAARHPCSVGAAHERSPYCFTL